MNLGVFDVFIQKLSTKWRLLNVYILMGGIMTEKRFVYYEHKGADYILDTPNKSLDFIEMLGDCLEAEEIVDLLNEQHETILSLHKTIEELDNCQKGQSHRINDLYLENKQLKDLITHLGYTIKYDGYRHISLELRE